MTTKEKPTKDKRKSFRLAAETLRQFETLQERWGGTEISVFERAIQQCYDRLRRSTPKRFKD